MIFRSFQDDDLWITYTFGIGQVKTETDSRPTIQDQQLGLETKTKVIRTATLDKLGQRHKTVNPSKPNSSNCYTMPCRPNLPFSISDIWALWRSALSSRVPKWH